jgi:c-di-GMP-binding flagellar brake protein YcgR
MDDLTRSVVRAIRTSSAETNRRKHVRYSVDLPCRVSVANRSAQTGRISDLSAEGASLCTPESLEARSHGTVSLAQLRVPLPFSVRRFESGVAHVQSTPDQAAADGLQALLDRLGPDDAGGTRAATRAA